MNQVAPFFYYSKSFPELLHRNKLTLFYSTYQAGKVIMISSPNGENITKYAKNFKRPMGIALSEDQQTLAIASKSEIGIFSTKAALAVSFPERKQHYDHLYIPQAKYYTGVVDTHEIMWQGNELLVTNTLFSCISKMSYQHHFEVVWKPEFITELVPEDRCHLNGVAMRDGLPRYATYFAKTNKNKGWRSQSYQSGAIFDIVENKVLIEGLSLPHSPVYFDNKIYFLQSATGEVSYLDLVSGQVHQLTTFNSFVRGMEVTDKFIFLGMSKIRKESQFFSQLPIKPEDSFCGLRILDRQTGKELAGLTYSDKISEIFAVRVGQNMVSPGLLTDRDEQYDKCLSLPGNNYWLEFQPKESITQT